jgi:hypothetical protein
MVLLSGDSSTEKKRFPNNQESKRKFVKISLANKIDAKAFQTFVTWQKGVKYKLNVIWDTNIELCILRFSLAI